MAWIESHQTLEKHGKLLGLADALGITKHQAIGHLHCLWWWAIDSAPIGDLSKYSVATIASAAGWKEYEEYSAEMERKAQLEGRPFAGNKSPPAGRFVAALIENRLLDYDLTPDQVPPVGPIGGGLRIHDWLDFCGDLVKKRLERQSEQKSKSAGIKSAQTGNKSPRAGNKSPPTVPYRTVPIRNTHMSEASPAGTATPGQATPGPETTVPDAPPAKVAEWFGKVWNFYPSNRRHGREAAFEAFKLAVHSLADAQRCLEDLDNYIKSVSDNKYLLRASRWFQEWGGRSHDQRGSGPGVHRENDVARQDIGNADAGVDPASQRVLHQLADRKAFPGGPANGNRAGGDPHDE